MTIKEKEAIDVIDRKKVIRAVDSCFDYWLEQHRCLLPLELENVQQLKADAIALLKEQEQKINELEEKLRLLEYGNLDILQGIIMLAT